MRIERTLEPLRAVASLFYPALCAICHAPVARGDSIGQNCLDKAPRIVAPYCAKCSEPFPGSIDGVFTCANCANRTLGFDAAVSAYRSRGVVRFVVLQFKYNRQLQLRHPIATWLEEAMNDPRLRPQHFDLVVPVPLHPARLRERGFNQAELLARILAQKMNIPLGCALERIRYHHPNRVWSGRAHGEFTRRLSFTKKDRRARIARASGGRYPHYRFDVKRMRASLARSRRALSLRRDRGARINHGHLQKTRDQNSRPPEARHSAGTFFAMSP